MSYHDGRNDLFQIKINCNGEEPSQAVVDAIKNVFNGITPQGDDAVKVDLNDILRSLNENKGLVFETKSWEAAMLLVSVLNIELERYNKSGKTPCIFKVDLP